MNHKACSIGGYMLSASHRWAWSDSRSPTSMPIKPCNVCSSVSRVDKANIGCGLLGYWSCGKTPIEVGAVSVALSCSRLNIGCAMPYFDIFGMEQKSFL